MRSLFQVLPADFFKPLTSKYKVEYADCILLIFNTFRTELSYGVNREIVVKALVEYFEVDDREMTFDEMTYIHDAREKANAIIASLKACGWIEYEQEKNHQLNVVLYEYAIPIIESMNRIIREEEAEYQGIISQIHASLQNEDLYAKPYELIIKGVKENTERLISELKKLNVSIKRHMDKQTNEMNAAEILDHFFLYHKNIGSKAYLRMKTSENISYFRSSIIDKIDSILERATVMERAVAGFMEIEQEADPEKAYDSVVNILLDVKSMFYRLDEIIEEIDGKHTRYMKNAVMRARFKLAVGNNTEGKLLRILDRLVEELNGESKNAEAISGEFKEISSIYVQKYISPESLQTIPVTKKKDRVNELSESVVMSAEERLLYKEALKQKNRTRFSRKNINEYVISLLEGKEKITSEDIPIESKKDLIRLIYISIYAGNRANNYRIQRTEQRVTRMGFEFPLIEIIKR